MSKYLVSAGVVWVFMSFVIGVIILLVPAEKSGKFELNRVTVQPKYVTSESPHEISNVAKTSVNVEGTPATAENAATASVEVLKK